MGAKQTRAFDPVRAARLDDPARESWLPTSALLQSIDIPPSARVLDYGTGTARYAIAIAGAHVDSIVVGYDSQDAMLQIARARVTESALENLTITGPTVASLGAATFDRVVAINVLHEMDEQDASSLLPLLAADGVAIFVDWSGDVIRPVGPPGAEVYRAEEACAWLQERGFRAELYETHEFPYHFVVRATI